MRTDVYPVFKGLTYSTIKSPSWGTRMQRAVSGRELRVSDYVNPIWTFTLTYSVLHDFAFGPTYLAVNTELRTLMNFFNVHRGAWDTFLFEDPEDNTVVGQQIGTGDSTTTKFQLGRGLVNTSPAFYEAITAPEVLEAVYLDGVLTAAYTLDSNTGIVTFTSAPGSGVVITADFTYFFRCRFANDRQDFEEFLHRFWEVKQLKLTSVVL
jgi:uncharacterized protein (TIGR02217 family)